VIFLLDPHFLICHELHLLKIFCLEAEEPTSARMNSSAPDNQEMIARLLAQAESKFDVLRK
jgi:hypothetical protein